MCRIQSEKVDALAPEYVQSMVEQASQLMEDMQSYLPDHARWLFGLSEPSALDAHLITFIARMRDVGRDEIIPARLQAYAEAAQKTPEWNSVVVGGTTMFRPK